jgi:hypothetical protein
MNLSPNVTPPLEVDEKIMNSLNDNIKLQGFTQLTESGKKKKRTKFLCNKCNKGFYDSKSFYRHLVKKKVPCDKVIDEKQYLYRHLDILANKYKQLKSYASSDLEDDIKYKFLKSVFKKCQDMLRLCKDNQELLGNEYDDIIYSINVMIQNCKTGNYENLELTETSKETDDSE